MKTTRTFTESVNFDFKYEGENLIEIAKFHSELQLYIKDKENWIENGLKPNVSLLVHEFVKKKVRDGAYETSVRFPENDFDVYSRDGKLLFRLIITL